VSLAFPHRIRIGWISGHHEAPKSFRGTRVRGHGGDQVVASTWMGDEAITDPVHAVLGLLGDHEG
jgi:hypothetical protein